MNRTHKILIILFLILMIIGLAGPTMASQKSWNIWEESIEKPAPEFVLKDLEDNEVRLSDYKGKVVLLDFTTTWCPYCRRIRPYLEKIHDRYNKKDFVLLSIYLQESKKKVKSYTEKYKIPYKSLLDEEGSTAESYGIVGVPTLILINKEGKIVCKQCRSVDIMLEEMF